MVEDQRPPDQSGPGLAEDNHCINQMKGEAMTKTKEEKASRRVERKARRQGLQACFDCRRFKPLEDFHPNQRNGNKPVCIQCNDERIEERKRKLIEAERKRQADEEAKELQRLRRMEKDLGPLVQRLMNNVRLIADGHQQAANNADQMFEALQRLVERIKTVE